MNGLKLIHIKKSIKKFHSHEIDMISIKVIGPSHFLKNALCIKYDCKHYACAQLVIQFYSVLSESYLDFQNPELFEKQ